MIEFETSYFSTALQMQNRIRILVPDRGPASCSTLYLLHGLSDDHSIWHRRSSVERYLEGSPCVVVMPAGGRGFYTDADEGFCYGEAMGAELIQLIETWFPVSRSYKDRYIAGLSMGGYGALRLALTQPHMYKAAASMSGALMIGSHEISTLPKHESATKEFTRIFGTNPKGSSHDLVHLLKTAQVEGYLPELWIDCGDEDFLFTDNQAFHQILDEQNVSHSYNIYRGEHNWDYWNRHLPDVLKWMGFDCNP